MRKTVLITGSSAGIGKLTAELFAERGWNVAATARRPEAWPQSHVASFPLDVTDTASIAAAVASTVDRFGTIDVLVNNAGYGAFGAFEGTSAAEMARQLATNVTGALETIRHVLPVMRARHDGTIVNVSSIGGRTASPFASLYHASKFAIEGFSESFRYEASLHGIRVKLVEPAHFKTGFIGRSLALFRHPDYDANLDNYMAWVRAEDAKAPTAEPVAETIWRAANDRSARLRYPVKGAVILAMTRLLPDAFWRPLLAEGMKRRPKDAPPTEAP